MAELLLQESAARGPTPPADTLLMIPGTMCDQRLWQPMLQTQAGQQLQQLFTIKDAAIWQQLDFAGMMETIVAPNAAHLLGFSMGGYLALSHLLTRYSTDVQQTSAPPIKSLVLLAATAGALADDEVQQRQQILQWLQTERYRGMSRKRLAEFIHPDQLDNPLVTEPVLAMDKALGHDVLWMQLSQTSARQSLLMQLQQVSCPVLIVGGRDDKLVATATLEQMAALMPNTELVLLPDCGHMLPLEQPVLLANALLAFYQRIGAATIKAGRNIG
ncbi:MAG: alpha/beta hydrolase [Gammaproteobacteria bacterium]|nr:alpha/beta hydrolase [Gammaproteobacteria bacterium]MBU2223506.1 alpha/beta hydrolase [Gammaproteobacteria bacterium]MBU2278347.1 alpha/beta hydrolase [Gammaproteobacteria bacterium]